MDSADCDGDGITIGDGDCDDNNRARFPGNPEICGDNIDNDCNEEIDDTCSNVECDQIDLDSAVRISSTCLTASTGAQALLEVDLLNLEGESIADGTIRIATEQAGISIGEIQREGDTFYSIITATENAENSTLSIHSSCEGSQEVTLRSTVDMTLASPVEETGLLLTGGCSPLSKNLRIRVINSHTQTPIEGASVIVGDQELPSEFFDDAQAFIQEENDSKVSNQKQTDAQGQARFVDFGNTLQGPQKVSVSATGYDSVTVLSFSGSELVVSLHPLDLSLPDIQNFYGTFTNPILNDDDEFTELGFLFSPISLEHWFRLDSFDLSRGNATWIPRPMESPGFFLDVPYELFVPQQSHGIPLLNVEERIDEDGDSDILVEKGARPFNVKVTEETDFARLAWYGKVDFSQDGLLLEANDSLGLLLSLISSVNVQQTATFDPTSQESLASPSNVQLDLEEANKQNATCTIENIPDDFAGVCGVFQAAPERSNAWLPLGLGAIASDDLDPNMRSAQLDFEYIVLDEAPIASAFLNYTGDVRSNSEVRSTAIVRRNGAVQDDGTVQFISANFLNPINLEEGDADGEPWIRWENINNEEAPSVNQCEVNINLVIFRVNNVEVGPGNTKEDYEHLLNVPLHRMFFPGDINEIQNFAPTGSNFSLDRAGLMTIATENGWANLVEQDLLFARYNTSINCFGQQEQQAFDFNRQSFEVEKSNFSHMSTILRLRIPAGGIH